MPFRPPFLMLQSALKKRDGNPAWRCVFLGSVLEVKALFRCVSTDKHNCACVQVLTNTPLDLVIGQLDGEITLGLQQTSLPLYKY